MNHFRYFIGIGSTEVPDMHIQRFCMDVAMIYRPAAIVWLAFDSFALAGRCVAFPVESKGVVAQIEAQLLGN